MKSPLKIFLPLMLTLVCRTACADLVVQFDSGQTFETGSLTGVAVTGADMAGTQFRTTYLDGSQEIISWQNSNTATGSGWSLNVPGDAFFVDWQLTNTGTQGIRSMLIDFGTSGTVIDVANFGTAGSGDNGRQYTAISGHAPFDIIVTHSDLVALTGNPPVGDLYRRLQIDFTNTLGFTPGAALSFGLDTDQMSSSFTAVPEPSALPCMAAIGIASVVLRRRRAANNRVHRSTRVDRF